MAIAVNATRLGTLANNNLPTVATLTLGATPAAGSTILVTIASSTAAQAITSVQDSRGNTYTQMYDSGNPGFSVHLFVYACMSQHGLQSGDFIYIVTTNGFNGVVTADEASGLGSRHAPDQSAGANSSTAVSSFSMGPTSATAYANELVWAVIATPTIASSTQSITPGTGYTQQGSRVTVATLSMSVYTEYKIVAATGAQTANGTINTTAAQYVGVVLTFPDPQSPESTQRGASYVGADVSATTGPNRGASFVGANVSARVGANRGMSFVGVEVAGQVSAPPAVTTHRRPGPILA